MCPPNICVFHTIRLYKKKPLVSSLSLSLLWLLPQEQTLHKHESFYTYTHIVNKSLRCNCDKSRKNLSSFRVLFLDHPFLKFEQRTYMKFGVTPINQLPSWLARFLQRVHHSYRNFRSLKHMSNGKELHSHSSKGWQFPETQVTPRWPLTNQGLPEITLHGDLLLDYFFKFFFLWNKIDIQ